MNFSGATILSYSNQYLYFGENTYNYKNVQNISVEGFLIDSAILSGDSSAIASSINSFRDISTIEEVVINNVSFGSGKFLDISFSDDGESPNTKKYNANLEVYKTGNLQNFITDVEIISPELIDGLSENFTLNQNSSNSKDFTHSIDVSYLDTESNDPLTLAKDLANSLITNSDIAFFINNGFDSTDYKKYSTESINLITNSYSISQNLTLLEDSSTYDYELNLSASTDSNGITTITENATVNGIVGADKDAVFTNAVGGVNSLIAGSYSRVTPFFSDYKETEDYSVFEKIISKNRRFDKMNGSAEYSIIYSNDPAINALYNWDYSHEISKSDGVYSIVEDGEIVGDGKPFPVNSTSAIERAKTAWNTIEGGIESRINDIYSSSSNDFRKLNLISKNITFSEINGSISYSYEYSSKNKESIGGITSEVTVNENFPVEFQNKFIILKSREIAQTLSLATIGTTSLTLEMFGNKNTSYGEYKQFVNNVISKFKPSGGNKRIAYAISPKMSFDPRNNKAIFTVSWNWHRNLEDLDEF